MDIAVIDFGKYKVQAFYLFSQARTHSAPEQQSCAVSTDAVCEQHTGRYSRRLAVYPHARVSEGVQVSFSSLF